MIKNRTPEGVKRGIFKLIVEGTPRKLACEVCYAVDAENPSFYHAAFTDATCSHINIYCPCCGSEQENMAVADCPAPFMIEPETDNEVSDGQKA